MNKAGKARAEQTERSEVGEARQRSKSNEIRIFFSPGLQPWTRPARVKYILQQPSNWVPFFLLPRFLCVLKIGHFLDIFMGTGLTFFFGFVIFEGVGMKCADGK
jgi:hypothetical protein